MIIALKIFVFSLALGYTYFCFFRFTTIVKGKIKPMVFLFFLAYISAIVVMLVFLGVFLNQTIGYKPDWEMDQLAKKSMMVFAAIPLFAMASLIWSAMINAMVSFHETHNAENLHRNPVKFVITNKEKIQKIGLYLFLINTVYISIMVVFVAEMG